MGGEEVGGFGDAHFEDLADVFGVELDLLGGAVEAHAVADLAMGAGGGEEGHLDFDLAIALAGVAAAAVGVEGEAAGAVTPGAGEGDLGEEFADVVEDADVGGGAGAGGFADGALIDFVDGVDVFGAGEGFPRVGGGLFLSAFDGFGEGVFDSGEEGAVEEGAFAGAADAGDDGEAGEGDLDGDVFEVVGGGAGEGEPAGGGEVGGGGG